MHNYDEVDLHDDDEHDEHHHHDDEIEFDEHIWFSIDVVKVAVNEITNALCTLDNENIEVYEQRKQTYISKLNLLDTKYKNALSNASKDTIIVCDRFPFAYLTDAYDINYYAAFLGCSAETEASFETITFLSNKIDELDTNNVIILESSKDKLAKTIIHSTKNHKLADIHVLDSMQSTTLAQIMNGKTYIGVMEENLETLKKVLN